jgi:predicted Fe-Mo cluster-binding NifX family protein
MNIKFAFAVNQSNLFEAMHFGDADKYMLYEWINQKIIPCGELINHYKTIDEEQEHGSKTKGEAIIKMFKENGVQVLVSKQFGKNIKMVNQYFIPVVIYNDNLPDILSILVKNMKWIVDELDNNINGYKLFSINKGILKSSVK